jgi:alginate O-acetyltransferase complex protein AlgI
MLFASPHFLFLFLPCAAAGFFLIGRSGRPALALAWLVAASLVFYSQADPWFVLVLLASLAWNYTAGRILGRRPSRPLLGLAIAGNLGVLAWFKYAGFFADLVNALSGAAPFTVATVAIPLGISFYTFQQIAYLVDAHDGVSRESDLLHYCAFATFFPQLLAGPIVRHGEVAGQWRDPATYAPQARNIALGLSAFAIGLFKKVILADNLAPAANAAFDLAGQGAYPPAGLAWSGAISYALQLYFDFSAYSDMAIGIALIFNIRLPFNFASPYKAASVIEFWERWHITLTRFLTTYLYNPVTLHLTRARLRAGKGGLRRSTFEPGPFLHLIATPTILTMALSGLWHGAGLQFVAWGLLHGLMLVGNRAWRLGTGTLNGLRGLRIPRPLGIGLTFLGVTVALVFFRAQDLGQAMRVLTGLAGLAEASAGTASPEGSKLLLLGLFIVWALPNTQQWLGLAPCQRLDAWRTLAATFEPGRHGRVRFLHGALAGAILCVALLRLLGEAPAEFLYFTF